MGDTARISRRCVRGASQAAKHPPLGTSFASLAVLQAASCSDLLSKRGEQGGRRFDPSPGADGRARGESRVLALAGRLPLRSCPHGPSRATRLAWLLMSVSSSEATNGDVAAPSPQRQRRGACWAGRGDAIGKRLRAAPSASTPHPRSCQSGGPRTIGNDRRRLTARRVSRLAICESGDALPIETRIRRRSGILEPAPTVSELSGTNAGSLLVRDVPRDDCRVCEKCPAGALRFDTARTTGPSMWWSGPDVFR